MAQITPQKILTLSEPVEQIYSNVVDALLVNLAKHLKSGKALATEQWELQKLSELGQLTQESVEIIANLTGLAPEEIQKAIENAALWATEDVEQALQEGAEKGAVTAPPSQGVLASESVMQALRALEAQAVDKTNLVNTNMLQSTLAQYRKAVANTAHIERQMRTGAANLGYPSGPCCNRHSDTHAGAAGSAGANPQGGYHRLLRQGRTAVDARSLRQHDGAYDGT